MLDDFQNHKFQVNLLSMLFHFIQANFNLGKKFHVFNRFQGSYVVYAGMVYKQARTRVLYAGCSKASHVQYATCPKDNCIHCARYKKAMKGQNQSFLYEFNV